jgi:general stress protein YciG
MGRRGGRDFTPEERMRGSFRGGEATYARHGSEHMKKIGRKGGQMRAARAIRGERFDIVIIDDPIKENDQ